jgi:O-antigen/teichoic acid export membrane protein
MQKLIQRFWSDEGLAARLFRGGAVLGFGTGAEQGLRFVRNMILTRLLAPEVFGLMAIVLSVNSLFQVLTSVGIKEAIIQNPRGTERTYLNGAWWLGLGRSFFLFLIAFVAAPWIASFYAKPELTMLIRVAFVGVLLQGAWSPGAYVALKKMNYWRWVLIMQAGGVIGVTAAVLLALYLENVWALVLGFVLESFARCVLSHVITPFRPGWHFERQDLEALFGYSRGIFGLSALLLIYTEGATFVVGKLCSTHDLGLYAMALTLARIPTMLGSMMVDLLIPAFSQIQHQKERVNRNLLKAISLIAIPAIPALAFVACFGKPILSLVYGLRYGAAAVPLALLFANEVLITFNMPVSSVFLAIGQPASLRRFSLLRAVLVIGLIYPAIRWLGLVGAAATLLVAMLCSLCFQLFRLRILANLDVNRLLTIWLRSLPLALPVLLVWAATRAAAFQVSPAVTLISALAASGLIYGGFLLVAIRLAPVRAFFWPSAGAAAVPVRV